MTPLTVLKHPSAVLPLAMSLGAIAIVVAILVTQGPAPQADEHAAAFIWRLLMVSQVPIILFFAVKWVPRAPREAGLVLALQVGAALTAVATIVLPGW